MDPIELKDSSFTLEPEELETFGKAPLPWQLRNSWRKPKRKRKSRRVEIDLWAEEQP